MIYFHSISQIVLEQVCKIVVPLINLIPKDFYFSKKNKVI